MWIDVMVFLVVVFAISILGIIYYNKKDSRSWESKITKYSHYKWDDLWIK